MSCSDITGTAEREIELKNGAPSVCEGGKGSQCSCSCKNARRASEGLAPKTATPEAEPPVSVFRPEFPGQFAPQFLGKRR